MVPFRRVALRAIPVVAAVAAVAAGCGGEAHTLSELPEPLPGPTPAGPWTRGALVVAHGGQGSPATLADGPAAAVEASLAALDSGGEGLEHAKQAAIAGVGVLEDDPRFNAGTGANLRLDGTTIQADAAIMGDDGSFGAVAGIDGIRHPIQAAQAVAESPHIFLSGPGAQRFAENAGLEKADLTTPRAKKKLERAAPRLFAETGVWAQFDWRTMWNFETPAPTSAQDVVTAMQAAPEGSLEANGDTVGVVLRSAEGRYVAALSTGGTTLAMYGRVGDVPQLGSGLYAGPYGAVAATGKGEAITRERVASRVYDLLAQGIEPDRAIELGMRGVEVEEGVGVIAVSELGYGAQATTQMAWAAGSPDAVVRADQVVRGE